MRPRWRSTLAAAAALAGAFCLATLPGLAAAGHLTPRATDRALAKIWEHTAGLSTSAFTMQRPPARIHEHMEPTGSRPAIEAVLRKELFDMGGRVGALILSNDLRAVPLPDFNATLDIPVLGDCDFEFHNGTLDWVAVSPDLTSVELTNNFMTAHLGNISFDVQMDFRYVQRRWPNIRSHGHAIMHGLGGNITALATFYVADNGFVNLFVLESATAFEHIDVDITESKAAWLYNAVTTLFRKKVQEDVTKKLNEEVEGTLPKAANQLFETMPLVLPVLNFPLNVSFAPPIAISPHGAVAHVFGLFQTANAGCPYAAFSPFTTSETPAAISTSSPEDRMLTFNLHQSIGQCFLWSLHRTGYLTRRIDHYTMPDFPKELLTSTTWAQVVPAIADVFGTDRNVSLDVRPTRGEPRLRVSPEEGVVASLEGLEVRAYVFDTADEGPAAPRTLMLALSARAMVGAAPKAEAKEGQLVFGMELQDADIGAELLDADKRLGEIDMERVNLAFKAALGSASDQLQQVADDHPVVVPRIPFIDILEAEVVTNDGVVSISIDVGYKED